MSKLQNKNSNLPRYKLNLGAWSQQETSTVFADVLAHFLLSLQSDHTRKNYSRDIEEFYMFCRELGIEPQHITDITEKTILLWHKNLNERHTQYVESRRRTVQSTIARKLSSVSSLLTFAFKRGLLQKNVALHVTRPKVKRESKTNALTADETKLLLRTALDQATNADPQTRQYKSNKLRYAVLYTLFSVGMRVDELCELRIADLEVTPQFARLHMTAKGGETHSPIIHEKSLGVLQNYIEEFRKNISTQDYLFVRVQNVKTQSKLTQAAVYLMISELGKLAGINKRISPHSCRATLATLLHNKGVPIAQIQDLLNHKQITTTAIYIKKAQELDEAAATKIDILAD